MRGGGNVGIVPAGFDWSQGWLGSLNLIREFSRIVKLYNILHRCRGGVRKDCKNGGLHYSER